MTPAGPDAPDTAAVLAATERLLRTLRGPLGGPATWEWGDLLAAATGRSPFDVMATVRATQPTVPDPRSAEPADVAAELRRMAQELDPVDGDRVRQVADLLDPRAADHTGTPASAEAGVQQATLPVPPQPAPRHSPAAEPAPSPPPSPMGSSPPPSSAPPTVLPGQPSRSPHQQPPSTAGRWPSRHKTPVDRRKRRRAAIPWVVIILAFLILRGCFGDVFDGEAASQTAPTTTVATSVSAPLHRAEER